MNKRQRKKRSKRDYFKKATNPHWLPTGGELIQFSQEEMRKIFNEVKQNKESYNFEFDPNSSILKVLAPEGRENGQMENSKS